MPLAEFGASQGDSCFVVVPAFLGGEKLQRQALSSALLATMNVAYPNEKLMNRKALWEEDLGGEQFDFEREAEGHTYRYRFKVLQGGGVGYLVAAWTLRRAVDVEAALTDALARVRFTSRPAFPLSSSGEFTARDKKTQGLVLNQAGLFHFNSGDYANLLMLQRQYDVALSEVETCLTSEDSVTVRLL